MIPYLSNDRCRIDVQFLSIDSGFKHTAYVLPPGHRVHQPFASRPLPLTTKKRPKGDSFVPFANILRAISF